MTEMITGTKTFWVAVAHYIQEEQRSKNVQKRQKVGRKIANNKI